MLAALSGVELPAPSRSSVDARLTELGLTPSIVAWMSTNLRRLGPEEVGDGYTWRFDLAGVKAMLDDYFALDLWSHLATRPPNEAPAVHLLVAGRGGRWNPESLALLDAVAATGCISAHRLSDAGHWVHVDAPDALAELLAADLAGIP